MLSCVNYSWTKCFKNCKNISTDGEVMAKIKVACFFLEHGVHTMQYDNNTKNKFWFNTDHNTSLGNEFSNWTAAVISSQNIRNRCPVMSCCRAIVDDVGDHVLPEPSVLRSPDELCWAYFVLQWITQAVQVLQSLTSPWDPPVYPSRHHQIVYSC